MRDFINRYYLTTKQIENIFSIPETEVRRLCHKGVFPGIKVKGKWYIRKNFFYKYQTPLFTL